MPTLNRLAKETSPYLQQHADNPVDWYPWGQEALEKAKRENKPILLSIGYSACHWCHVMAHESFADPETAQWMNQLFVNIKVDREERPDLDKIYQTTHQMLTDNPGGWPLTVFLHPVQNAPFFSGTYFPKEPRYQLPAFKTLLRQIADFYHQHQQEIATQSQTLLTALQELSNTTPSSKLHLNFAPWQLAIQQLAVSYDPVYGGFGHAPKFPNPNDLCLLTCDWFDSRQTLEIEHEDVSLEKVTHSLLKMAQGGIYDQIGGGFYRYSVDAQWHIPHFEKMLYDNGQLLFQYAQADAAKPQPIFKKVLQETADWIMREMQSPEGGYYSSIDADSEGTEGRFYLWTPSQMQTLLTTEEYQLLRLYFNLDQTANFEGHWHLQVTHSLEEVAQQSHASLTNVNQHINSARTKLLQARENRIKPARDEKILTAWNALTIKGMILAAIQLQQPTLLDSAERALAFIFTTLWKNNRLLATNGRARLPAYLDDYAFLLDAILIFLQYRWNSVYFTFAQTLAEVLLSHFFDQQQGGFFFVADDHESLLYRPKTFTDDVIPAGNSVACFAIQRLGYLLGEPRYLHSVEKTLLTAWQGLNQYPAAHSSLLIVLREYLKPPKVVIIRGDNEDKQWQTTLQKKYSPWQMIFSIDKDVTELPAAIAEKKPATDTVAYVCQGQQCLPPVASLLALQQAMNTHSTKP